MLIVKSCWYSADHWLVDNCNKLTSGDISNKLGNNEILVIILLISVASFSYNFVADLTLLLSLILCNF